MHFHPILRGISIDFAATIRVTFAGTPSPKRRAGRSLSMWANHDAAECVRELGGEFSLSLVGNQSASKCGAELGLVDDVGIGGSALD